MNEGSSSWVSCMTEHLGIPQHRRRSAHHHPLLRAPNNSPNSPSDFWALGISILVVEPVAKTRFFLFCFFTFQTSKTVFGFGKGPRGSQQAP